MRFNEAKAVTALIEAGLDQPHPTPALPKALRPFAPPSKLPERLPAWWPRYHSLSKDVADLIAAGLDQPHPTPALQKALRPFAPPPRLPERLPAWWPRWPREVVGQFGMTHEERSQKWNAVVAAVREELLRDNQNRDGGVLGADERHLRLLAALPNGSCFTYTASAKGLASLTPEKMAEEFGAAYRAERERM